MKIQQPQLCAPEAAWPKTKSRAGEKTTDLPGAARPACSGEKLQ